MPKQKMIFHLTSAILLSLSVFVPSLGFFIWFAFIPFLLVIQKESLLKSFLTGLVIGGIFFSCFLYWITYYEARIFIIVIAITIPFFGFFTLITNWLSRNFTNELIHIFAPPIAWSTTSFLYALTPLEIIGDQIAFTQASLFPQIVRIAGLSGISFLVLLSNSLIAYWIQTRKREARNGIFTLLILLLLGTFPSAGRSENPIKVALVQHNFPISLDWRLAHEKEVLLAYERAIREHGGTVDLIVFPQYGLPIDVLREPKWLNELVRQTKTVVLLSTYIPKIPGGSLVEGERFDTALLFSPDRPVQEYRAVTPPPFRQIGQVLGMERKPLHFTPSTLPLPSEGGEASGSTSREARRDRGEGVKIGLMLCYEDARPEEGRRWVQNGAEIIFALSNPGHFLGTPLPRYHLVQDQIRAIETGRYLVRVSPNGFSAVIDPNGKTVVKSNLNEVVTLKGEIHPISGETLFSKMGLVLPLTAASFCFILFLAYAWRASINRFARKIR